MVKARETNLRSTRCLKTILYVCDIANTESYLLAGCIQMKFSIRVQRCNWNLSRVDPKEVKPYCIIAAPFASLEGGSREKTFKDLRAYFPKVSIIWLANKKQAGVFIPMQSEGTNVIVVDEQTLPARRLFKKIEEITASQES
jgi:hypothetical protein